MSPPPSCGDAQDDDARRRTSSASVCELALVAVLHMHRPLYALNMAGAGVFVCVRGAACESERAKRQSPLSTLLLFPRVSKAHLLRRRVLRASAAAARRQRRQHTHR